MSAEKARIHIVDDLEAVRNVLEDYVTILGFTPILSENGESALTRMAEHPPDLVLLDIMMPKMTGYDVLEQ